MDWIAGVSIAQSQLSLADAAVGPGEVAYLVDYRRPAEDETEFIAHYRAHHPAIMARFPGLRRLELGLPLDWQPAPGML